jgi:hypothetical protein
LDSGSDLLEPTKAGTWTEMHNLFMYLLIRVMHALNIHTTFGDVQRDVGRGVATNPGP